MIQIGNIVQEKVASLKKKGDKNSSSVFEMNEAEGEVASAKVSSPRVQVSSLWTLQEVDGYAADKKKMREVGGQLLDELNQLRFGLIAGELEKEHIRRLSKALDDADIELQFPELQDVIDDIRLRAAVELAKLGE